MPNSDQTYDVLSFGTVYLDIDFISFPFEEGLFAHRETIGSQYTLEIGGSAYNFAKMCAGLDLQVLFGGKLGDDELGSLIKTIAAKNTVTSHFLTANNPTVQTNLAAHYVHQDGSSIMTSAGTANQDLSIADINHLLETYISQTKYLYLGGGLKLLDLLPHYQQIIAQAKQHGVQVILDHGRVTNVVTDEHLAVLRSIITDVDIYLPSKDEFLQVWKFESIEQGLRQLGPQVETIVVKDSVQGCYSIEDGEIIHARIPEVVSTNTVGAGDTFNAGFIAATCNTTGNLHERMVFAAKAAALKIATGRQPTVATIEQYAVSPTSSKMQ